MYCYCNNDPYDGWYTPEPLIKLGDRVTNGKIKGIVINPGPYGDQPLQILDTKGECHSFIDHDGTSPYSREVWRKIK